MRHIYRQASRTLIWLGEEADNSTLALEFAQQMSVKYQDALDPEKVKEREAAEKKMKAETVWYKGKLPGRKWSAWDPNWLAYFTLLDREWFQRAWVVQALALSTNAWIIAGSKAVSWRDLASCLYYTSVYETW